MANETCKNCGGNEGLHHYKTNQCPVGGRENMDGPEEYMTSTFEAIPEPKLKQNAPAFPETSDCYYSGLTKREIFAMSAMQGILSNEDLMSYYDGEEPFKSLSHDAVTLADALLEALAK